MIGALLAADAAFAYQQTAIVPAIHDVERSLNTSSEWSAWLVTVYLIVATIATPAMGRLADLHGRRRMLLAGLVVFTAGSAGAALAPNIAVLLICRAVQGIGGSVYPLTLALARRLLPRAKVATAVALFAGTFGLGGVAGFASGGLLAQYASWRWIFVVGAALVAAGCASIFALVPATGDRADGRYDWRGTLALAIAAIGLLTALTLAVPLGWASPVTAALLALALAAAVVWVRLEARVRDPLIDLHVVLEPAVLRANLATVGLGWALFGTYLLVPEFALARTGSGHYGLGMTTAAVGLIMVPLAVGQAAAGPLAGLVSRRAGPRPVFAAGLILLAAALGWLSAIRTSLPQCEAALLILGTGAGAALQSSSNTATQGVSQDVAATSSSLNSTIRRFAGGIGGQVAIILLASYSATTAGTPPFSAFTVAYLIAVGMCLAGALLVIVPRGPRRRGQPRHRDGSPLPPASLARYLIPCARRASRCLTPAGGRRSASFHRAGGGSRLSSVMPVAPAASVPRQGSA